MTGPARRLFTVVILLLATSAACIAQDHPVAGCALHDHIYTCQWAAFQNVLAAARTVAIPVGSMDRFTGFQLRGLANSLGKAVSVPGKKADLEFDVTPRGSNGISLAMANEPLATLRIFAMDQGQPKLVWAETLRGEADRPWAGIVQAVIQQFQARLAKG